MSDRIEGRDYYYVGTYGPKETDGIYLLSLNSADGTVRMEHAVSDIENPSYLEVDAKRGKLYAVSETDSHRFDENPGGAVHVYQIESASGNLTLEQRAGTGGGGPCHVSAAGNILAVTNYGGGSAVAYSLREDGSLDKMTFCERYEGSGPNPERQEAPHPHSAFASPDGRYLYVSDLGLDRIVIYRLEQNSHKVERTGECPLHPGAGPRHLEFHPRLPIVYGVNELDSTVTRFEWDSAAGALTARESVSTLPSQWAGDSTTADIHVSPCGRHLYVSNRGHDSITLFRIEEQEGRLTFDSHYSSGGRTPRNFVLSPDGRFLLAANQDSDRIAVFAIDPSTGALSGPVANAEISKPVCIRFWRSVR